MVFVYEERIIYLFLNEKKIAGQVKKKKKKKKASQLLCPVGSVGSSHWMEAEVSGLTVHYGLFERCVTTANDVTTCDAFDWPGWLYGDRSQGRAIGISSLNVIKTFL